MGKYPVFTDGELSREIAIRGLSQEEFAKKAGVDAKTISRAVLGKPIRTKSFGKILIAIGQVPPLNVPAGLMEQSA